MIILAMTLLGVILGSFFNVCILRFISGESIVAPPSHCPKCNHQLAWYDLIPEEIAGTVRLRSASSTLLWSLSRRPLLAFLHGVMASE